MAGPQRMRNKIPCSAERLSLLDPPMIQSVVDRSAFHIGNQYLSENRVRIVEADESQISSAVIGNSGLYEQTIRLKDGHLISKCSCSLPEEPMCRHCIAVLLEYHRWAQPRTTSKPPKAPAPSASAAAPAANGASAATAFSTGSPDLKLSEMIAFVEWVQPAMKAIERGQQLPDSPRLGGEVGAWIHAIQNLEARRRESEEVQVNLESEMRDREAFVTRMTQQLQASMTELKVSQTSCQQLQQELTSYRDMLGKLAEIASEVGGYDSQLKSVAGELLAKGTQLDKLAGSFREVATALRTLAKPSS